MDVKVVTSGWKNPGDPEYFPIGIGDMVSAYDSGYFEVIRIEDRMVYLIQRFKGDGTPVKKAKEDRCDMAYCMPAAEHVRRVIAGMEIIKKRLSEVSL